MATIVQSLVKTVVEYVHLKPSSLRCALAGQSLKLIDVPLAEGVTIQRISDTERGPTDPCFSTCDGILRRNVEGPVPSYDVSLYQESIRQSFGDLYRAEIEKCAEDSFLTFFRGYAKSKWTRCRALKILEQLASGKSAKGLKWEQTVLSTARFMTVAEAAHKFYTQPHLYGAPAPSSATPDGLTADSTRCDSSPYYTCAVEELDSLFQVLFSGGLQGIQVALLDYPLEQQRVAAYEEEIADNLSGRRSLLAEFAAAAEHRRVRNPECHPFALGLNSSKVVRHNLKLLKQLIVCDPSYAHETTHLVDFGAACVEALVKKVEKIEATALRMVMDEYSSDEDEDEDADEDDTDSVLLGGLHLGGGLHMEESDL